MTYDAMEGSLLHYEMAIARIALPQNLCQRMDTPAVNAAVGEIIGAGRSARVGALHFVAGANSFESLVAMHIAEYLDLGLRERNSSIAQGIQ